MATRTNPLQFIQQVRAEVSKVEAHSDDLPGVMVQVELRRRAARGELAGQARRKTALFRRTGQAGRLRLFWYPRAADVAVHVRRADET